MRFLVISKSKHLAPPDMMAPLFDAMIAWSNKLQASGKAEAMWSLAQGQGGGGIMNVDSLEELNTLMLEFPFAAFSDIEVLPIVDLVPALQRAKQVMAAMMQGGGGR